MAENVTNNVKSLKQELRETILLAQQLSSTPGPEFDAAVEKAAELRDRMNDVNEQIGVLTAGGKFEALSNSIGDVGGKILSLDFEGAKESAERLVQMGKSITFGDAIKSVKDLGSTFLQLGKALLTNPLFLIAAVIAGIVIAVIKLMDKIGLLKVITKALGEIFDWLMTPINAIIDGLKQLTDWFGWTNNAAADASKAMAENAEKTAQAYEERSGKVVQGLETEIKLAELSGESTREAELKKAYFILNTAKARAKADVAAYQSAKLQGDLDEEELKDLEKKYKASQLQAVQAADDIKILKATFRKEDRDAAKKANEEDLKAEEDAAKKKADAQKKAAEDAKKRREEQRKAQLAADQYLRDLELQNMADGVEKELAINQENFNRLRKANEANALITAEQRAKIDAELLEQSNIKKAEIQKKYNDQELAKQKEQQDKLKALQDEYNAYVDAIAAEDPSVARMQQYDKEIADLETFLQNKIITQEEYAALEKAATEKAQADIKAIEDKAREEKEKADKEAADKELANKIKLANASFDAAKSGLQGVADLVNAFAGKSVAAQKKAFETTKKLNIAMAVIDTIKGAVAAFTGMTSSIPGPVGLALGAVAAAGVTASGIANIQKIKSTTFEGGGNAGGGSTPSANVNSSAAAQPSFNLIGNPNQGNNATSSQSVEAANQQPIVVQAVVSETEITSSQERVAKYQKNAEL